MDVSNTNTGVVRARMVSAPAAPWPPVTVEFGSRVYCYCGKQLDRVRIISGGRFGSSGPLTMLDKAQRSYADPSRYGQVVSEDPNADPGDGDVVWRCRPCGEVWTRSEREVGRALRRGNVVLGVDL